MHVTSKGMKENAYRVLMVGNWKESVHLKNLGKDERIIIKLALKTEKQGTYWINLAHKRQVVSYCKNGSEICVT